MTASQGEEGLSICKLQQSQLARAQEPDDSSLALLFIPQMNIIEEKGLREGPKSLAVPKQKYLGLVTDTRQSGRGAGGAVGRK